MKVFIQCISFCLFGKLIKAERSEMGEVALPKEGLTKHNPLMKTPQKVTEEGNSSSSEEDDSIVIKISENKKKKLSSNSKKSSNQRSSSEKKNMKKAAPLSLVKPVTSNVSQQTNQKTEKSKTTKISPFDFDQKKSSTKSTSNPLSKKTSKMDTFSPIDSTYKSPTSDFLLKDFESKSVKITLTEQEVKDLEVLSKNLDSFIPSLTRSNVIVKNMIKTSKQNEEATKNKSNKPSELFNIKVIEVSDNNTPN